MPALSKASPSLHDAIGELLKSKEGGGRRPRTIENLRQFLARYAQGKAADPVSDVCSARIQRWIAEAESAWGRRTRMAILSSFYSFCTRRGWVTENPIDRLEKIHIDQAPPKILTVAQCRAILDASGTALRPWVVLGLFAGLRPTEAERLDWSAIRIAGHHPCVVVDAAASKVRRRRIVPLCLLACAWLALDVRPTGRIVSSHSTLRRARREVSEVAGVPWSQDVLRHSYASYRLGRGDIPEQVACDMGNSPRILRTHYVELVTREAANEFWGLLPSGSTPAKESTPTASSLGAG